MDVTPHNYVLSKNERIKKIRDTQYTRILDNTKNNVPQVPQSTICIFSLTKLSIMREKIKNKNEEKINFTSNLRLTLCADFRRVDSPRQ